MAPAIPTLFAGPGMSTLGEMKTRIRNETKRPDMLNNGRIEAEIRSAINHYRPKRFWFNEKRSVVLFDTEAGRSEYGAADQANIPNLVRIDSISITADGRTYPVKFMLQDQMEVLLGSVGALANPPAWYSYYEQVLRFYPVPDKAYPVRAAGVIRVVAPVDDDEADNPWMTDAEELIRSRAKSRLYANSMLDLSMAAAMRTIELEALDSLITETSSRSQVRSFEPSEF